MDLYLYQVEALASLQLGKKITTSYIARKTGYTENHLYTIRKKPLSEDIIQTFEVKLGVKLSSNNTSSPLHTMHDMVEVHYWEGCEEFTQGYNSNLRSYWTDKELIGVWKREASNLRIINMFTDKMDGGRYPIYKDDVLLIDITDTQLASTGVYVFTTEINGVKTLSICGIRYGLEDRLNKQAVIYYTNDKYEDKVFSLEIFQKAKLKVIGRVLKDLSITI